MGEPHCHEQATDDEVVVALRGATHRAERDRLVVMQGGGCSAVCAKKHLKKWFGPARVPPQSEEGREGPKVVLE